MARRGCLGRALRVGLGTGGLVGVAGLAAWSWLHTARGQETLRGSVESLVNGLMVEGSFQLGGLETDLVDTLVLREVALRDGDGALIIGAGVIDAELAWAGLLRGEVRIARLRGERLVVDLDTSEAGRLVLLDLFGPPSEEPPSDEPWGGLPVDLEVGAVDLGVTRFRWGTAARVDQARITGRVTGSGTRIEVPGLAIDGVLVRPSAGLPVRIAGDVVYVPERVDVNGLVLELPASRAVGRVQVVGLDAEPGLEGALTLEALDLGTVDRFVGIGLAAPWTGTLTASGPFSDLGVTVALAGEEAGSLALDGRVAVADDIPWHATLAARTFALHRALPIVGGEIVLDGDITAQGHGTSWPDTLVIEGTFDGTAQEAYGLHADDLDLGFAIREGVLTLSEIALDGVIGKLQGGGTLNLLDGTLGMGVHGTVDPALLADFGAEGFGGSGTVDARVTGRVFDEGAPIAVGGSLALRRLTWGEDLAIGAVDVGFDVGVRSGAVDVGVRGLGTELAAYGATAPAFLLDDVRVGYREGAVDVGGDVVLSGVSYGDDLFTATTLPVDFAFERSAQGRQTVDASLALSDYSLIDFPGQGGTLAVSLVDDRLELTADLRDGARPVVTTHGFVDLPSLTIALDDLLLAPTPRAAWVSDRPVRLRVVDGGVRAADLTLGSPLGRLTVQGTLGLQGDLDGMVRVEDFQLDTLADLVPGLLGGLAGVIDLDLTMAGDARSPRLSGTWQGRGVWVPEQVRWLDLDGTLDVDGHVARVVLAAGIAEEPLLDLDARIGWLGSLAAPALDPLADNQLALVLAPGSFRRFERLRPGLDLPDGRVSGALSAQGTVEDLKMDLDVVVETVVAGLGEDGRAEIAVHRDGDQLAWWVDAFEGFTRVASMDGKARTRLGEVLRLAIEGDQTVDPSDLTTWVDDLDVTATLLDLPIESLAAIGGVDADARGVLTGTVGVSGPVRTPELVSDLRIDGVIGGVETVGRVGLSPSAAGYALDVGLAFEPAGDLAMTGYLPFAIDLDQDPGAWLGDGVDMRLGGSGLPLGLLGAFSSDLAGADGLIAVDGSLGGGGGGVRPALALTVRDGIVPLRSAGVTLRDVALDARLDETSVSVDRISATTTAVVRTLQGALEEGFRDRSRREGGNRVGPRANIEGRASVALEEWTPTDVSADLSLFNAWLTATDDLILKVTGNVDAQGTWPELQIRGDDVQVVQGRVAIDTASLVQAAPLEPDRRVVIHRGAAPFERVEEDQEPSFFESFDIALGLSLGQSTQARITMPFFDDLGGVGADVTRVDLDARVGGDLDFHMHGDDLGLVGELELLDGTVQVLQSRFDIDSGGITFIGDDLTNPLLDIDASMPVSSSSIQVRIDGTPEQPSLAFSSDTWSDQTEIFTILLTGRAPEEMTSDQGVAAATMLGRMLLNSVLGDVQLVTLSIEPDGSVKVGVPLYRTIYAETILTPEPGLQENTITVRADWNILRRLVLSAAWGNWNSYATLSWETRF